jgi:hypothetical protein
MQVERECMPRKTFQVNSAAFSLEYEAISHGSFGPMQDFGDDPRRLVPG